MDPVAAVGARRRRPRAAPRGVGWALVLLATAAAAAPPAEPEGPTPAVWRPRDLNFTYSTNSAVYSCPNLAGRVATILRSLGVRDDVQVQVVNCSETYVSLPDRTSERGMGYEPTPSERLREAAAGPRQASLITIRAMVPTEVTPEVLAELRKDKSRRELISRVTGDPLARFDDPVPFNAERRVLTLSYATIKVMPEDCELLEQMSSSVLRQLGMRILRRPTRCSTGSKLRPELRVETLVPVMHELPGDEKKREAERAPEDDDAPVDALPSTPPAAPEAADAPANAGTGPADPAAATPGPE